MGIKRYKPTSAGRRSMTGSDFAEITRSKPEKSLTSGIHKSGGRNNQGRTTAWCRGGGHKRRYRLIDFKRNKTGIPASVKSVVLAVPPISAVNSAESPSDSTAS